MKEMNERLRLRIINTAIHECADSLSEITVKGIFQEIVGVDKGENLVKFLVGIGKTTQGMRFLTLCYREDDIEKWISFLKNESNKKDSKWNQEVVKDFMDKLNGWWKKDASENHQTDGILNKRLRGMPGEIFPNKDEYMRWRREALKRCIRNTIKGQ
ncbi:MAG: hypothetical protein AB1480_09775 [Nitrospirota bacterium]